MDCLEISVYFLKFQYWQYYVYYYIMINFNIIVLNTAICINDSIFLSVENYITIMMLWLRKYFNVFKSFWEFWNILH